MKSAFDILSALQQIAPASSADRFIVAISGGVDSVVLARLCKEAGLSVELAHCNFQLRGAESDRDEALVRQLADAWKLPLVVNKVDLAAYASEHALSVQEAARQYRYQWFKSLLSSSITDGWILTAHHADDNAETVAMNFFRGTGLAGLTGIPARNERVLRPLLGLWRSDIEKIARQKELPFVEDSSNVDEKYTRNYFRHTIFPALEKIYPKVKENLKGAIERFSEIESLYAQCMDRYRSSLLVRKGNDYRIAVRTLRRLVGQALLYELFTPFGFSSGQLGEIKKLLLARTGAQVPAAAAPYRLVRHRNFLLLTTTSSVSAEEQLIDLSLASITFEAGRLDLSEFLYNGQTPSADAAIAWLDARCVRGPLLLRRWKEGDYFYPLGMRKKKKLARFFIDQKRSVVEKENTWVIEAAGKIVWVVGMRIDDRAKITAKTKQVLAITFTATT